MSAYSTLDISRTKARELILNAVLVGSDETLEELADVLLRDRLYNCKVVDDQCHKNNDADV